MPHNFADFHINSLANRPVFLLVSCLASWIFAPAWAHILYLFSTQASSETHTYWATLKGKMLPGKDVPYQAGSEKILQIMKNFARSAPTLIFKHLNDQAK